MAGQPYRSLLQSWPDNPWLIEVCEQARQKLASHPHGDMPRWLKALQELPRCSTCVDLSSDVPSLGMAVDKPAELRQVLMNFHPWRNGPLELGGIRINTDWRSDWKWDRVKTQVDLSGQRVLDIGCGNGYFGLRMLAAGARLVVGIDPTLLFVMQVFSMGVLYHRKDPVHHLKRIRSLLVAGGSLALETLVLPAGREAELLVPEGRYARMRNVWAIPGIDRLVSWVHESGFRDCRLVNTTVTTTQEQRSTDWMQFESLDRALDPQDQGKTLEGHPAPVRAVLIANKP
jgi:tRNA (mo5U34)-methyltransferase